MPSYLGLVPKMTGSTSSGPPQPPKGAAPKTEQLRGKLTSNNKLLPEQSGQPMQLTPLWEHVVRTRQFPASVDAESIFREIFNRLKDAEWEVRQHAFRVLVDVMPVLEQNIIDKLMSSIIPEIVTNLDNPVPAVRKGALDTLRVYFCYTQNKENIFRKILDGGFNQPNAADTFQSNIGRGAILSVPSLLFPSFDSLRPPEAILKFAINALASRLVQFTYQEAALRSLVRICETIGAEEFDSHMLDYNANIKRDFEVLCDVYNVKTYQDTNEKSNSDENNREPKEIVSVTKHWSNDTDLFGTIDDCRDEEDDPEDVLVGPIPPARVVLETDIKFDEETAITMTILEEKDKESEADEAISDFDSESDFNSKDAGVVQILENAISERRNTRRRVRFGGEVVKLRTPDSDEANLDTPEVPRTKIPLPLFPATKMPLDHRKATSQPISPVHSKHSKKRSLSSSPKKEFYVHNALLSPKKSILVRSNSPVYVIQPVHLRKGDKVNQKKDACEAPAGISKNQMTTKQPPEPDTSDQSFTENLETREKSDEVINAIKDRGNLPEVKRKSTKLALSAPSNTKSESSTLQQVDVTVTAKDNVESENAESRTKLEKITVLESSKLSSCPSSCVNFVVFPKQERNYILMELSSPERKKNTNNDKKISANDSLPAQVVNDTSFDTSILEPKTEKTVSGQLLNQIIDGVSMATGQISRGSEATITQHFAKTFKSDLPNTSDVVAPQTIEKSQSKKSSNDSGFPLSTMTNSVVRNLQSSKELLDQLKGNVKVISTTLVDIEKSDNDASSGISVDKKQSFRELPVSDMHIRSASDPESESLTYSSSESEGNTLEPSWEELGLVDQEILNDLHNKDDWRAKVRGLERTASALRTSSALVTIEPRLGSLLQTVLGGERSSRIAAAGMVVAKILISGVSEDALRQRLPQVAWGLARQGGPHAAQLARIVMLRLRPALLMEQLLQPHCLGARNGKTRENSLQLLIFSLVTFPSTEFKVQTMARKVAETVGDRRRRVRQAALDTLAVLGQIYEAEEVLEAGEKVASGRHDGDAMKAAIRSRLARKSLPLVSADGLVVYGLQISPNVRIATGADVDWIVAGSGPLSPGSGQSRGQLIGITARVDSASIFRSESARSNPWTDRPDIVSLGANMGHRGLNQPLAWQLFPIQNRDDQYPKERAQWASEGPNVRAEILNGNSFVDRLGKNLLKHCPTSSNSLHNLVKKNTRSSSEVSNIYRQIIKEYLRERFYEFCRGKALLRSNPPLQKGNYAKAESRIPILHSWEQEAPMKEEFAKHLVNRMSSNSSVAIADRGSFDRSDSRDTNVGYASMYQRRRRLLERNAFQALQFAEEVPNHFSFSSQYHELDTTSKNIPQQMETNTRTARGQVDAEKGPPHREFALPEMLTASYRSAHSSERRDRSKSRSQERHYKAELKTAPRTPSTLQTTHDTYGTMYQRRRRLINENAFLAPQSIMNGTSYYSQQIQPNPADRCSRSEALRISARKLPKRDQRITDMPMVNLCEINVKREDPHASEKGLRNLRSQSKENELERNNEVKIRIPLKRNPDKTVDVNEDRDVLRHHASLRSSYYEIQSISSRNSQYQVTKSARNAVVYKSDTTRSEGMESSNSSISVTESRQNQIRSESDDNQHSQNYNQSSSSTASRSSRSSTPLSQTHQGTAVFDVVPFQTVPNRPNSVNSYLISTTSTRTNLHEKSIAVEISDEDSSYSDIDVEHSVQDKLSHDCENHNTEHNINETFERKLMRMQDSIHVSLSSEECDRISRKVSRELVQSTISLRKSDDSPHITHSFQQLVKEKPRTPCKQSPASRVSKENIASNQSITRIFSSYNMQTNESSQNLGNLSPKLSELFTEIAPDSTEEDGEAISSFALPDDSVSLQSLESRSFQELNHPDLYSSSNSASIVRSLHSRSSEHLELEDNTREDNVQLDHTPVSLAEPRNTKSSLRTPSAKIVTSVAEPAELFISNKLNLSEAAQGRNELDISNMGANKMIQPLPLENELPKNQPSNVPRMKPKPRVNSLRSNQTVTQNIKKSSEKPKTSAQFYLAQLENKDWEVIMKGLKTLSQIARQDPTQLDQCRPGNLGRVLGRHVKNLRSQVSRAACLAARDVFVSHPKGIEQEIDDIAGPLLHRTADTNKFLRADSNAALNSLVENISPHKTIGVIVQRGATHQNAIVRATTARLLSDVVSRIGPEQALALPREVRDKLLATGAKLLIDGNLDARNFTKQLFRGLLHCEGFQKALTDAVPETTLRHIDKTLRTL